MRLCAESFSILLSTTSSVLHINIVSEGLIQDLRFAIRFNHEPFINIQSKYIMRVRKNVRERIGTKVPRIDSVDMFPY